MTAEEQRVELAGNASPEQLEQYLHDPSSRVLRSLLKNGNLTEEHVLVIANRTNISADVLETIAKDRHWLESYPIRLALARNPRSPLQISLSQARFLRVFDLEEITRSHFIPLVLRHKVEAMINERIPTMPLGNKKTLAKKAAGVVLLKLLQDRIPEVVGLCLDNPHMIEAHLYKVISRRHTSEKTIVMIARHPRWSIRPLIRLSLIRNEYAPLALSERFLRDMKLVDLRELYDDPTLPVTVKPFVHRELLSRGRDPETIGEEPIYEIGEDEMEELNGTPGPGPGRNEEALESEETDEQDTDEDENQLP